MSVRAARAIRAVCLGLAAVAACAWVGGYLYINALACAFGSTSPCRVRMPWRLTGDDLSLLVLFPGATILILLFLAGLAHRRVRAAGPDGPR